MLRATLMSSFCDSEETQTRISFVDSSGEHVSVLTYI